MKKIKLTDRAKEIFIACNNKCYKKQEGDSPHFSLLVNEGLIDYSDKAKQYYITHRGRSYLLLNPKLKNPTIWDDRKYLITTAISILALAVSVIALKLELQ